MNNINLKVEEFKNGLYDLENNRGLPVSVVYYSFKFVEQDLENTYYETLNSIKTEEENNSENIEEKEE